MPTRRRRFTSESVSMGHPDKVADRISDSVLDYALGFDPHSRVACETFITGGLLVIGGEIRARELPTDLDDQIEQNTRDTIRRIGYSGPGTGFDPDGAEVRIVMQEQSVDIARGVDNGEALGAGDQGLMFGYATNETDEFMPLPIVLSHRLVAQQAAVREAGVVEGLRPDAKAQITVAWGDGGPKQVESVLLSTQHHPMWNDRQSDLRDLVVEHVIRPAMGDWWNDSVTVFFNPTGRFEKGGPEGDTGLTGRKIIVDTYGGWARHGGGAFSGKDASKVDRSASYMARYVAKNVVAAGLADECELRLSYAIGIADPTAISIDCHGTARVDEAAIENAVMEVFDLTPGGIITQLDLARPIYEPTSYHGHFGRNPDEAGPGTFTWERTDRIDELRSALGSSEIPGLELSSPSGGVALPERTRASADRSPTRRSNGRSGPDGHNDSGKLPESSSGSLNDSGNSDRRKPLSTSRLAAWSRAGKATPPSGGGADEGGGGGQEPKLNGTI